MKHWIQTFTGKVFSLENPHPSMVCIEDIAHALSRICRYTGHVNREHYSVAQHCVEMSYVVEPEFALWALLHDATEAYISDLAAPIKRMQEMDAYCQLEWEVERIVCESLGIHPDGPMREAVKIADLRMLITEAQQLLTWPPPQDWEIDAEPYDIVLDEWSPEWAKASYLDRYVEFAGGK